MPLRPATDFPPIPEPEALGATCQECRAALMADKIRHWVDVL
jgi:hypothetical protein